LRPRRLCALEAGLPPVAPVGGEGWPSREEGRS
jgi:hypothetical protein